ncbi:MAG: GAF domain-containing sensor histidine kinase [Ignavibacteria bacterium]
MNFESMIRGIEIKEITERRITNLSKIKYRNEKEQTNDSKNQLRLPGQGINSRGIFTNIQLAVILFDINGSLKWHNNKITQMFANIFGNNLLTSDLIINSIFGNRSMFHLTIDELLSGAVIEQEKEFITLDESTVWLEIRLSIINSRSDVLLSLFDITQRKCTIQSLNQYDSILSAISFASEMFLKTNDLGQSIDEVLDKLGKATGVNRIQILENHKGHGTDMMIDTLFEWSDEEIEWKKENRILRGLSYKDLGLERWAKLFGEGEIIEGYSEEFPEDEIQFLRLDNVKYILAIPVFAGKMLWGFIRFDYFRKVRRMTCTETDAMYSAVQTLGAAIQRISFEKELIIAKDEAEKSDRLKTEFLAQMSHEIRTPVNSILCFTSLLENELIDKIPEELKSCFTAIDNGSRRLIRTIDMILNMSQFQSDSYEANYRNINLTNMFFEKMIEEFHPIARTKNLKLCLLKQTTDAVIYADTYTLEQIFINLIDNAIKFTVSGEINIIVYRGVNSEICVDVKDTGLGISRDYLSGLFTPFTQEEMGYTRKFEGNGLGLALVKKYLEINRAKIFVNSEKNVGTTFSIIFRS